AVPGPRITSSTPAPQGRSPVEFQFTTRSEEAVTAAAGRAAELGNHQISSMHLLWVLTQQTDGIGRAALEAAGADPEQAARRAEEAVRALPHVSGPGSAGHPTVVRPAFKRPDAARREAHSQSRTYLSTEHRTTGIALGKDPAAKLRAGVGAGRRALRDAVTRPHPGKDPMN